MAHNPLSSHAKSPDAIKKMRQAGKLAATVLDRVTPLVKPGVTTEALNAFCHKLITEEMSAIPAPLNYRGFPKSICTSVNHVICHGIPSDKKALRAGDIINIDVTVIKDGYHGDTSRMYCVGKPPILAKRLVQVARECLYIGINMVKPGTSLKAIGKAIADHAHQHNFSSVRDFCGHGIGTDFHEEGFHVLHYDNPTVEEQILVPGLTFTIEPMINVGSYETKTLADDWTVVTKDKTLSAQWEHTLLCTQDGVEILTLGADEKPL